MKSLVTKLLWHTMQLNTKYSTRMLQLCEKLLPFMGHLQFGFILSATSQLVNIIFLSLVKFTKILPAYWNFTADNFLLYSDLFSSVFGRTVTILRSI